MPPAFVLSQDQTLRLTQPRNPAPAKADTGPQGQSTLEPVTNALRTSRHQPAARAKTRTANPPQTVLHQDAFATSSHLVATPPPTHPFPLSTMSNSETRVGFLPPRDRVEERAYTLPFRAVSNALLSDFIERFFAGGECSRRRRLTARRAPHLFRRRSVSTAFTARSRPLGRGRYMGMRRPRFKPASYGPQAGKILIRHDIRG